MGVATALGIPKSAITLTAGETARLKTLRVSGDPVALTGRLMPLLLGGQGR